MLIEVYVDVVCPWAYIGKRRLEAALAELGDPKVAVLWRPYLLDPTAPAVSVPLADQPEAEAAQLSSVPGFTLDLVKHRVAQLAIAEGLPAPNPAYRVSTWAAHRLIQVAAERGAAVQAEIVETIMAAHFAGRDINRIDFLAPLSERYGLQAPIAVAGTGHALAYLEPGFVPDDPSERLTREAYWTGRAQDVASSPTFLLAGDALVGAQSVEAILEHLAVEREPVREAPDEVRRIRLAEALLARRDPHGCLYVLAPLRPEHDDDPNLEILAARALLASASLRPAREKLERLVEQYPGDAYLHGLLGRALKRLGDPGADAHLAIAGALDAEV